MLWSQTDLGSNAAVWPWVNGGAASRNLGVLIRKNKDGTIFSLALRITGEE